MARSAGGSSSSGPAYDPELLKMTIEDLEMEVAQRQSYIASEEKKGNGGSEEVEQARQETVQFQIALADKEMQEQAEITEFDEGVLDELLAGGEEASNDNQDDMDVSEGGGSLQPALIGEDGNFVSDEAEALAMVDLLSIDLSPEAFELQQREQLEELMVREQLEREVIEAERDAREAEAARKQAEKEAEYKQDGEYDRNLDPRNDVDGFIKAGMPIETPKILDGYAGRAGGQEYKSDKQIRSLNLLQVQASANFRRSPLTFVKKWQKLQLEWRMDAEAKVAKFKDLEREKAASRAKREAIANVNAEKRQRIEIRLQAWRQKASINRSKKYEKELKKAKGMAIKPSGAPGASKNKTNFSVTRRKSISVPNKPDASGAAKRKRAKCQNCSAIRELDHVPAPGWTCEDSGFQCKEKRHCKLCGRNANGDGPQPPGWVCKDSGEFECLSPDERKGKYAKK